MSYIRETQAILKEHNMHSSEINKNQVWKGPLKQISKPANNPVDKHMVINEESYISDTSYDAESDRASPNNEENKHEE